MGTFEEDPLASKNTIQSNIVSHPVYFVGESSDASWLAVCRGDRRGSDCHDKAAQIRRYLRRLPSTARNVYWHTCAMIVA